MLFRSDASYIKWRSLYVGYTLPAKALKNVKIQEISFGVQANQYKKLSNNAKNLNSNSLKVVSMNCTDNLAY